MFFRADRRIRSKERTVMPKIMPPRRDSVITMASDALNGHKRKETATGPAF